jgi:hypothetical protein
MRLLNIIQVLIIIINNQNKTFISLSKILINMKCIKFPSSSSLKSFEITFKFIESSYWTVHSSKPLSIKHWRQL